MERLASVVCVLVALPLACGSVETSGTRNAAGTGQAYVLTFSGAEPAGTLLTRWTHLAFTLDLSQPYRELHVADAVGVALPELGVAKIHDRLDCHSRIGSEQSIDALVRSAPVEVEAIDVEVIAEAGWGGGVCFGSRGANGVWTWNMKIAPFTYDAATDRWRAHLGDLRVAADAIKVIFDAQPTDVASSHNSRATRIVYTTRQ